MAPQRAGHGELFPLPLPGAAEAAPRSSLSRGVRQRVGKRRARANDAQECVAAMNSLAGWGGLEPAESSREPAGPVVGTVGPPGNAVQRQALQRVTDAVAEQGSAVDPTPDAALRALLQTDSLYGGSVGGVQIYREGCVSLPADQKTAPPIAELLHGEALLDVQHVRERMLLSEEELEGRFESGVPPCYHDPCLKRSKCKYMKFVCELFASGLVRFSEQARVEIGCFFCV